MARISKEKKDQYRTWVDMPYAAMNRIEAIERRARIEANRRATEGLAPNAFADDADIPESDSVGKYYTAETNIDWGRGDEILPDNVSWERQNKNG